MTDAPAPVVKPLVWKGPSDWNGGEQCHETVYGTSLREYRIISCHPDESWGEGRTWYKLYMTDDRGPYPTLERAKAAAQADYEARILSALTVSPAPVEALDPHESPLFVAAFDLCEASEDDGSGLITVPRAEWVKVEGIIRAALAAYEGHRP